MTKNDVKIQSSPYSAVPTWEFRVADRTTSSASATIKAGEPIMVRSAEGGNDAVIISTGKPVNITDIVLGVAAKESTEAAATTAGVVETYLPLQGIIWRCNATTGASLVVGQLLDTVTFTVTTGTFTVNESEGTDEDVHGLRIMDFDTVNDTVDFIFKDAVTLFNCLIA